MLVPQYAEGRQARLVASPAKRALTPPFMVVHAQKTAECRSFRPLPALGSFTSNDIPRADGSISKTANIGVDVVMTIRLINVYFCELRNSPIPEKMENYFSPISAKPGTKRKRDRDEMQDEFAPSSEIEDDEALCILGEEETLEAEAYCIDDEMGFGF